MRRRFDAPARTRLYWVLRALQRWRSVPVRAVVFALAVTTALVAQAAQTEPEGQEDPRTAFLTVCFSGCPPAERVAVMERIVKESPESEWADDALWALGEECRQRGNLTGALRYWQFLLSRWPAVELERETRALDVFQGTSAAWAEFLLTMDGLSFTPDTPRARTDPATGSFTAHSARRLNTVPMAVWFDLGQVYEGLGCHEVAFRAYTRATALVPAGCRLAEVYGNRAQSAAVAAARSKPAGIGSSAQPPTPGGGTGLREVREDTAHARAASLAQPADRGPGSD